MRHTVFVLSVVFCTPVFAQTAPTSLPIEMTSSEELQEVEVPNKKTTTSVALSLGTTIVSPFIVLGGTTLLNNCQGGACIGGISIVSLGFSGMAVGPSLGHFYSKESKHGIKTSIIRGVSLGTTILGAGLVTLGTGTKFNGGDVGLNDNKLRGIGFGTLIASGITFTGLTIYDVIDSAFAPKRMKKQKENLEKITAKISLVPAPMITPNGKTNLGFLLSGSF